MANKFYVWCDDITNVENANAFENDSERASGFIAGSPARALKVNSALRQANLIACALTSVLIPNNNTLDLQSSRNDVTNALSTALINIIKGVKVDNATNADNASAVTDSYLLNKLYPIGTIYMCTQTTSIAPPSPASWLGGTWTQLKDCFLWATGDTTSITYRENGVEVTKYLTAGSRGGELTHLLTTSEMPSHSHVQTAGGSRHGMNGGGSQDCYANGDSYTSNYKTRSTETVGGSLAHNNMPPYLAVYAWERIA